MINEREEDALSLPGLINKERREGLTPEEQILKAILIQLFKSGK